MMLNTGHNARAKGRYQMGQVKIGDKVFKDQPSAMEWMNQEMMRLAEANKALEAKAANGGTVASERSFSVTEATYSAGDKAKAKSFLQGKPKGNLKITGPGLDYGVEVSPLGIRTLLEHKDEIMTFVTENEAKLAANAATVKELKAKNR